MTEKYIFSTSPYLMFKLGKICDYKSVSLSVRKERKKEREREGGEKPLILNGVHFFLLSFCVENFMKDCIVNVFMWFWAFV